MKAAVMKAASKKVAAMKAAMKGASSKSGLVAAVAASAGVDAKEVSKVFSGLVTAVEGEVKKNGTCKLPGLCVIKVRAKAATKAGKKMMFGKLTAVKAKPASKVVKVFAASSLKKAV